MINIGIIAGGGKLPIAIGRNLIKKNFNIYFKYLLTFFAIIPVCLLLVMQPDMGQTLLIFLSWSILVFISGVSFPIILTVISFTFLFLTYMVFFISKFGYIKSRIQSFFNPIDGAHNFQPNKAIEAISSGGFFGKGIGEGTLKNKVPEAHTDYIIAIVSEEYGSIISIMIIAIFLYISFRIIKNCIIQKDEFLKLSLCGLASLLIFQTFIHIGVNTTLLPTTGMTLPFLSYGGSSMIGSSILAGIILNFTRKRYINEDY